MFFVIRFILFSFLTFCTLSLIPPQRLTGTPLQFALFFLGTAVCFVL